MNQFFDGMPGLLQGFWWVAIIASIIFIFQTILTLIGAGGDADSSGGLDGMDAPFQMFTLANLINFMLGFGWTGVALYNTIHNSVLLVLVAVLVGIGFILLFFFVIKQFLRLSEDNTFDIHKLVGRTGDVYFTIPGNMSGKGKVQISLKGSNHDLPAMTPGEALLSGTLVKVISVEEGILIVNKIS